MTERATIDDFVKIEKLGEGNFKNNLVYSDTTC